VREHGISARRVAGRKIQLPVLVGSRVNSFSDALPLTASSRAQNPERLLSPSACGQARVTAVAN
jgi:hypothetical protein